MYRGTTPTIILTVTNEDGTALDLTEQDVYVTFHVAGGNTADDVTKRETDMTITTVDNASVLSIPLTQAETLAWEDGASLEVQLRCKGSGIAQATNITDIDVERILLDGEI